MPLLISPSDRAGRCQAALLTGYATLLLLAGMAWHLTNRLDAATRPWAEIGDSAADRPARPSVLFLFRVSDGALALRDIERWNALFRQGDLEVRGVVLDSPRRPLLDDLARLERIAFPIRGALPRDVLPRLRALGVPNTPVSLILDRQGGVRLVLPAARQADAFGLVDSLLAGL